MFVYESTAEQLVSSPKQQNKQDVVRILLDRVQGFNENNMLHI